MNRKDENKAAEAAPMAAADATAPTETIVPAEPPPMTREEWEELKARAEKADENWNRFLRAAADLENFKKRAARERQEAIQFANEGLATKLLPVLDSFDKALTAASAGPAESPESLRAGIDLIQQQFKRALAESGLGEIDALGKPFDPKIHEAIAQQESAQIPEGQVVQQIRKGYKLRERLLRPASVVVARPPAPQNE